MFRRAPPMFFLTLFAPTCDAVRSGTDKTVAFSRPLDISVSRAEPRASRPQGGDGGRSPRPGALLDVWGQAKADAVQHRPRLCPGDGQVGRRGGGRGAEKPGAPPTPRLQSWGPTLRSSRLGVGTHSRVSCVGRWAGPLPWCGAGRPGAPRGALPPSYTTRDGGSVGRSREDGPHGVLALCALSECSVPGRSAEAGREGEEATAREDVVTGQMALREGDAGPSSWTRQGADGRPSPSPRRPYRT